MPPAFPVQPGIAVPPQVPASPSPESLPSLSLEWSQASGSSSGSSSAIAGIDVLPNPSERALRIPGAAPISDGVPPCHFSGHTLWAPQPGSVIPASPFAPMNAKNEESPRAANFSQLMLTKPEGGVPASCWYRDGESVPGSALVSQKRIKTENDEGDKRPRTNSTVSSPDTSAGDVPKSSTPSRDDGTSAPNRKSNGARRPPPSASQITEAGQPFPVIDTSAKHSSLFIPPDTSGLTKREARLVKNRAAAFLSRQRKREQFEELGGKCKLMARLVWMLYEAYTQAFAAGTTHDRVLSSTPFGATLKNESDECRQTLDQIVHKQGAMVFEGMNDERLSVPPQAPQSDPSVEQLNAELAAVRAENKALRAKLEQNTNNESESQAVVPARRDMQSAFMVMLLVALSLARVPMQAPRSSAGLVHELLGNDNASGSVVRMSVSPPSTGEPLLCSLMIESATEDDADSKRDRSATPDAAQQCDGSSDTSAPSLLSAQSDSPAPSSLSSTSATRCVRRIMAFSAGDDAVAVDAPPLAAFDVSILRELESVDLGPWVNEFSESLSGDASQAAANLRDRLTGKVDLAQGFFLVASAEDGSNDGTHLSLYARGGANTDASLTLRVLGAAKEALAALGHNANESVKGRVSTPENTLCSTPVTCAAAARKRRDAGVFQLTYHP